MNKFKNGVAKLLNVFKVGDASPVVNSEERLSNRKLMEELLQHFEMALERESVGEKMLYPMSFNILMTPQDYAERRSALPFVFPEVLRELYKVINRKRSKYPNFDPPARYWYFQVSQCVMTNTNNGEVKLLTPGHITTVASLYTFDVRTAQNVEVSHSPNISVKMENSNRMENLNINYQALQNMDILGDDIYTYNFNREFVDKAPTEPIAETTIKTGMATLEYMYQGHNIRYTMTSPLIHISGRKDQRKGSCYFKLESDSVMDSHVQIKYQREDDTFKIAVFGPVLLNSSTIEESKGGKVVWHNLSNRSNIYINNEINVKFEKIK